MDTISAGNEVEVSLQHDKVMIIPWYFHMALAADFFH
jgi:hypothetical protein